ncbi:hypothetical protein PVK06_008831 [Gossypium arboreum]|uniref:Aminotransferase-like plant mobile domain-containing protein n=1 Tax=Gossypium arboreum TaxID=29729 RepID=A0ABR0QKX2_GOSAR|nr:hypothetical protein PVK06_008831 [Gossypium arboreum]
MAINDHQRPPTITEHLQTPPTIAIHSQRPPTTADQSMDPNPNVLLNDNDHIAANVHKIHQISELRANLISVLVERLRPETHTFHLPCGEVTITLQNVTVQLGLSINGEAVTGLGRVPDPWGTCERVGMLIRRALSSDKAVYERNGRLLPSTAVLGIISNTISGISEPPTVIEQQQLFVSNVSLIHFHMVEWHDGGRVLMQFGCAQPIPNPSVDIKEVHEMDKKGSSRDALNWKKHEPYISLWNMQHSRHPSLYVLEGGFSPMPEYAAWYMAHGKPFIFQGHYMLIQEGVQ